MRRIRRPCELRQPLLEFVESPLEPAKPYLNRKFSVSANPPSGRTWPGNYHEPDQKPTERSEIKSVTPLGRGKGNKSSKLTQGARRLNSGPLVPLRNFFDIPLQRIQVAQPGHGRASRDDGAVLRLHRLDIGVRPRWLVWDNDVEPREVGRVYEAVPTKGAIFGDGDDSCKLYVPPSRLASFRLLEPQWLLPWQVLRESGQ